MNKKEVLFIVVANFILGVGVGMFSTWYCGSEIIWWMCVTVGFGTALFGFWIYTICKITTMAE